MQRKHWAIAVVGAAALAAAVTWQSRRNRESTPPPAAKSEKPAASAPAPPPHAHAHGHERETPVDEPELRSGAMRVLVRDDPRGTARLDGRVVDAAGAPVAGATITVDSRPPRQASSGRDGGFSIEGLLPRTYLLTARATGGVAGPITATAAEAGVSRAAGDDRAAGAVAPAASPVLTLRPGGQVSLEVVDEQQRPLAAATVELRGLEGRTAEVAQGRAELAQVLPGAYQVAAWADGHAPTFLPAVVSPGKTSLRLELAPGMAVSGQVLDDQGQPVAAARVRYEASGGPVAGADLVRDAVTSDAQGRFAFAALPAGSFRFVATHAAHATAASELIKLDSGAAPRDVVVKMAVGAAVRGAVVEASGAPARFARVRVGITAPGARLIVPSTEVTADAAGAFVVTGLPRSALTAVALHDRGAATAQALDTRGGDLAGVTLRLDAVGVIAGTVVDAAGQPVAGAQVSAFPGALDRRAAPAATASPDAHAAELAQWQLRGFPRQLTDTRGAFALTGLPPGAYRLRASRGEGASAVRGGEGDVTAAVGDAAVRLTLPAEGGVKGKVTFDDGTAPAQLTVAVGLAQHGFRDGELQLEGLAPQTYQLVVRGPGFTTRMIEVKVEGGKTADLGTVVVSKPAAAAAPR